MPRKLVIWDLAALRRMYFDGWPTRRIARELHVDRSVIERILKERGLPRHSHKSANIFLARERTEAERRAQTRSANVARRKTGNGRS
jgi:hypothetical protein